MDTSVWILWPWQEVPRQCLAGSEPPPPPGSICMESREELPALPGNAGEPDPSEQLPNPGLAWADWECGRNTHEQGGVLR